MRGRLVAMLVVAILVGAGCGSGESGDAEATLVSDSASTASVDSPTTTAVAGDPCNASDAHPPGLSEYTLVSGGVERTYFVHVPDDYTAGENWPLIVSLHALGFQADRWFDFTWKASAQDAGYILVLPEAVDEKTFDPENPNFNWADRSEDPDVPFILGVLDDVARRVCIDPDRIYASGASDGADMVTRLACEAGDRFAAVRPYIGMNYPEIFELEGCEQPVPVPMTSYIGALEPYYALADIEAGLVMWADRNGCVGDAVVEEMADGVTVARYLDCDDGATVELYTLPGVAHAAAQVECAENLPGFCVTYPFDTTRTMLEFFNTYSR